MQITNALAAGIALLALTACGENSASNSDSGTQDRRVEAPASATPESDPAPVSASATEEVADKTEEAAVTPKAPTAMPEPENPIIAFKSEDGSLSLAREALTMVSPVHDSESDAWSVFIQLDKEAAEDFYTLTSETTGEALSVVVDDMTVSTPILETAVYGGGFVFQVDGSEVATNVVATLQGKPAAPAVVAIEADDALQTDVAEEDTDTAATEEEEPEDS